MIKIAHLSDIHFGNHFSKATWNAVADVVVRFDPNLIVVSGDLVDNPAPAPLLAAKCALSDLTQRARDNSARLGTGRVAELIVIPGNHDVFESGLAVGLARLDWFERIFDAPSTGAAEAALKRELDRTSLGFDAACLGFTTRPQDAGRIERAKAWLVGAFSGRTTTSGFASHLVQHLALPRVRTAKDSAVLLALLDSNPSQPGPDAATGVVDNDELIALQEGLDAVRDAKQVYIARVAIVHHHVLPIAFASGVDRRIGEPMMVLRNAGAVLRILADHKFDLVLHGHWHKPQFARIDFGSDDSDSYPMAVAAAGSAAMTSANNVSENSINLITIADSGRIGVKSLYYGAGRAPNPNNAAHCHDYREPLSAAKRRAYFRARERHDIECAQREQICQITENGDLWVTARVEGLRVCRVRAPYKQRPLGVAIPRYGHFVRRTFELDEGSSRAGFRLSPAPNHPGSKPGELEYYYINLPKGGLEVESDPVSYAFTYGCANCMKMTAWEARQRTKKADDSARPADFDDEWVAARISYPTGKLVLKATFPQSLAMVQVHVECRRHPQYPLYNVDDWGDADSDPAAMEIDSETHEAEQQALRYDAPERAWILEIDRPIVGYQYALRWKVPDDELIQETAGSMQAWQDVLQDFGKSTSGSALDPSDEDAMRGFKRVRDELNDEVGNNTRQWRRDLLSLGKRIDEAKTISNDNDAMKQFDLLYDALEREVYQGGFDEKWVVALFVYDSEQLALNRVLSRGSWPNDAIPLSSTVPYGDGVEGAAFQQRRIIAWNRRSAEHRLRRSDALIKPVRLPGGGANAVELVNMLALPVYHSGMENLRQPPPWAGIGVVTIGSSSYASPIGSMDDAHRALLRLAAQIQVDSIIQDLHRPSQVGRP